MTILSVVYFTRKSLFHKIFRVMLDHKANKETSGDQEIWSVDKNYKIIIILLCWYVVEDN